MTGRKVVSLDAALNAVNETRLLSVEALVTLSDRERTELLRKIAASGRASMQTLAENAEIITDQKE